MHMKVSFRDNINFEGIPISDIKVLGNKSKYKLYDIDHHDTLFLNKMYESVNLEKLMPKMHESDIFIWNSLLKSAIDCSKNSYRKTFLETCDNVPCGILNYTEFDTFYHLNYVVTFPTKPENRVPYAGQILFNELFQRFLPEKDVTKIEMQALRNSPFNPISKYLKLGFWQCGGDNYSEGMKINKAKALNTLNKQSEYLTSTPLANQTNTDLCKVIDLFG